MKITKKLIFILMSVIAYSMLTPHTIWSQWLAHNPEELHADHPDDAMKWFINQRTFGLGYIPKNARLDALRTKEALETKYRNPKGNSIQSLGATWTNIGPYGIDGQFGTGNTGRVNVIVAHPTDKNIAWLGAAEGGIWKTTNGGGSWKPMSDNTYSLAIGGLDVDPTNPNILYAGTGDGQANDYFGCGMIKSTDGGNTWNLTGLEYVGAFMKVIVNPTNPSTIYAAGAGSGGGLYISSDAGKTWTKATGDFPVGEVTDISYANNNGKDVLYAAVPAHGIYQTVDGGASWTNVQNFFNGVPGQMRRLHVAVDPKNWKDVVALSVNYSFNLEALTRSTDGGNNWDDLTNNIPNIFAEPGGSASQGWYDAYVTRDPSNPDNIIAGGISIWTSNDGGNNWTDAGQAYQPGGIHPDQHACAFAKASSGTVYAGSDGGVAISNDGGNTFSQGFDSLAITQSYDLSIDQTQDDITYIGTQDNGTLGGGRSNNWSQIGGGDGGTTVADAAAGGAYFINPGNFSINPNFNAGLQSDKVQWLFPILKDNANHYYTGTQYLYYASSAGGIWTKRNTILVGDTSSYLSAIGSAGDGKTVLVGTTGGKLWSTTNNGISFTDRTKALPGRVITDIKVSPADNSTFYITLSGFGASHVMKTTDIGATWKDISGTLPDIACNRMVIDDQHPTNLYIATDIGIFFSPDDGTNWMPYGSGLPNVVVPSLTYHKKNRVLRAGTYGRSVWEAPMIAVTSSITTPTLSNVWYVGESAQIGWYGVSSPVKIEISTDNTTSWQQVAATATGNIFTISTVSYLPTETAIIRVTSGSDILLSQSFRIRTRAAGTTLQTFSEQPLYMYDVAYDKDDNTLWVTNFNPSDNKIYKIDPNSGKQTGTISVSAGRDFTGIKYDPSTKHLFVHQSNTSTNSSFVYELDITGKTIHKWSSPSTYGTGIFVAGDSLFLADRNHNIIHVVSKQDPTNSYYDIDLTINGRVAPFGPRCITLDPSTGNLLHTWTDFQGTDANATLYDSYILRLKRDEGTELSSYFVQDGTNSGTNVRGIELDPRAGGTTVWVTVLNSGNSSKILKITLVDGPKDAVTNTKNKIASFGANYPNPFSESTTLPYSLDKDGVVKLIVHDVLGREVYRTSEQYQNIGDHQITLPLQSLVSGRYFCELYINGIRSDIRALVKE